MSIYKINLWCGHFLMLNMQYKHAIQTCNASMQYKHVLQTCNTSMQYNEGKITKSCHYDVF